MTTIKISELQSLLSGSIDPILDVLPIVDISEDETKKVTVIDLKSSITTGSMNQGVQTITNPINGYGGLLIAAHAEGYKTTSLGSFAHAEGYQTTSIAIGSHSEGVSTTAVGNYSHAEGEASKAIGANSHAEGAGGVSIGNNSHAEGSGTTAIGVNSHAEGSGTTAIGGYSHTEGYNTIALSFGSHAEGYQTTAKNKYTHAQGDNSIAGGEYQSVMGSYNIEDSKSIIIIGAGSASGRINGSMFQTFTSAGLANPSTPNTTGSWVLPQVSSSLNFTDDTAAAAGGVPLGGMYRSGSLILIRIS